METLYLRIIPESKTVALRRSGPFPADTVWRIYPFGDLPADVTMVLVEALNPATLDPPTYTPESF